MMVYLGYGWEILKARIENIKVVTEAPRAGAPQALPRQTALEQKGTIDHIDDPVRASHTAARIEQGLANDVQQEILGI